MNWFGAFAARAADGLFWPFVLMTIACVVIGGVSWFVRDGEPLKEHSAEYHAATWRMFTSAQAVVVMWLSWGLLNAVPPPDYIYRDRVKEVIKEASVAVKYDEAYTQCRKWNDFGETGRDEQIEDQTCATRALTLAGLKPSVVIKKVPVEVTPPREARYRTLFNTCMGKDVKEEGWAIVADKGENLRDRRIQLCHAQTKEVVQ